MSYLIDTNVISELIKSSPNENVILWFEAVPAEDLYLSVLSLGEIRKGVEGISDAKKKEKLRFWLEHELSAWFGERILEINRQVVDYWGRLQASAGRSLPAIDSLIAATALHFDCKLVTRNVKDFNFPGLTRINPWL